MAERFTPREDARPIDTVWPELIWPIPEGTELEGQVVVLRRADPARDADGLFAALDDDRVWSHLRTRPASASNTRNSLSSSVADSSTYRWVVILRRELNGLAAGTVVGQSSYLDPDADAARLEIGSTAYSPKVWATSVNPEAKLLLLHYAFDTLRAGRVQLKTDIRNQRSQEAIARLGASYEGVLRRHARRDDGTMRDSVMFSIIAEEWPQVRENLTQRIRAGIAG